ncbi:MAG TPA: condensation domain-containing protein, partial [Pyrinomonadaceae bacterium]
MSTTLSERLKKLSPAKRMLLLKSMREGGARAEGVAPIARRARGGAAPLSFAQQRLWFLNEFAPGGAAYNLHAAVRLTGRLRVDVLERTLTEIVRRHESLRTTFAVEGESPAQVVAPAAPVRLELVDLGGSQEPEAEARRLSDAEAQRPFDLARGPLFRCALLRLDASQHVVLFTTHHIVSDGWSAGVLVRELFTLYEAYSRGEESPLEELPIQYADYAAWQRGWLQGEVLEEQLSYWRGQLAGAPPVLELPTDRPRPAVQSQKGAAHKFVLDVALREELKRLGRREGATLFMTLLAAFQVLLSRYTGQSDVVVGSPVAGRGRLETEGLIGFFVNTLALRARMDDNPTFAGLLRRVRETTLGAFAHQDVPFEKLVEELQPGRSTGHTPLFQVVFVMQNAPREEFQSPGLTFERFEHEVKTAKFDLTLSVAEAEEGLRASVEYAADLFDAETVGRLAAHFETLLRAAAADPEARVSELPLLDADERRRLLDAAGDGLEYPQHLCLHELFERQVRLTPDAPALTFDGASLTYSELNARANRLAHYLRRHGVGAESRVALLMERSAGMVVSVLAVLKAGGCYVPLDPQYPPGRLAFMLEDSGAEVILTESSLAGNLASGRPARLVCLDAERDRLAAEASSDPGLKLDPGCAAYVIYTSGSTGRPKGVVVTHANVGRLFDSTRPLFSFSPSDVWTLFHSYAFDFSVWELWGALLHGGRLVVVPYWVSRSPEAFRRLLAVEGVTVLSQTPSAFRQLIAEEARAGDGA